MPRASRTYIAVTPAAQWGWQEILANKSNYLLELLIWSKTKDATKKFPQNRPKPFVPEFMGGDVSKNTVAHSTAEIDEILARPRS